MAESPAPKEQAASSSKPKATDAAERKASELGVSLDKVEPTGAEGQAKVEDVERAAAEGQMAASKVVEVKLNPDLLLSGAVAPDGTLFEAPGPLDAPSKNQVSESYFNDVLADAKDGEGRSIFLKEEV